MKLRINGNSVRFRLSKSDVEKLSVNGYLEEHTAFTGNTFIYALQSKKDISELSADFNENKISVFIPKTFAKEWAVNSVIGVNANLKVSSNEILYILIEKDFKCLNETEEDQSDNFDNPNKSC